MADDHLSLLIGYQELLRQDFDVVGTLSHGRALLSTAIQLQPDVIVVDLSLPALTDMTAAPERTKIAPQTKILVLAKKEDASVASGALREWASGVVLKRTARRELITAIRQLCAGKSYVTSTLAVSLDAMPPAAETTIPRKALTPRQREVLQLFAEGKTMRETANALKLTTRTVAFHKYRIMRDFGLRNSVDLLKFAIRERLASADA